VREKIIIANASGFWGDEAAAVRRQVLGGPIHYLTMDYLAEITMIILGRQKAESEAAGYARDFVSHVDGVFDEIVARGITVIANAGGMNPGACARALEAIMERKGVRLPIAVVDGDDLMPRLRQLADEGVDFRHLDSDEPIGERLARVNSANAYIGAKPIVSALAKGARIVVTGRTYDAASVVAPMVYEFGWSWEDWDKLAAALLAGHMIECGSQVTGGNYSLWRDVASYEQMGYPLVEVVPDGSFTVTKHPGTGGIVNVSTVTEQVLYEIGDPRAYASPDVVADFTSFRLEQAGADRVRVTGVRGRPPSDSLKVSMTYEAGYKLSASVIVSGPDAIAKAKKFAEIYWPRVRGEFIEKRTDLIGYSGCWGESGAPAVEPNEIVLRFSARAADPKLLGAMARELAGIALAGPAGICGAGGRPQVSPAFGYWPALIPRSKVTARMWMDGRCEDHPGASGPSAALTSGTEAGGVAAAPRPARAIRVPLGRVAYGRSGDKGNNANIGIAALRPELYPELLRELTAQRVAAFYSSNVRGSVARYQLDNLRAMNFVLREALGGGGTTSLLVDAQGKTLAQGLMNMQIDVASELVGGA
jgi:hypothetical protein